MIDLWLRIYDYDYDYYYYYYYYYYYILYIIYYIGPNKLCDYVNLSFWSVFLARKSFSKLPPPLPLPFFSYPASSAGDCVWHLSRTAYSTNWVCLHFRFQPKTTGSSFLSQNVTPLSRHVKRDNIVQTSRTTLLPLSHHSPCSFTSPSSSLVGWVGVTLGVAKFSQCQQLTSCF